MASKKASRASGRRRFTARRRKDLEAHGPGSKFTRNSRGGLVSKTRQRSGQESPWILAVSKAREEARKETGITGFVPVGGKTKQGKELLKRARAIHGKRSD